MSLNLKFKDIDGKSLLGNLAKKKKSGKITQVMIEDRSIADLIYIRSFSNFNPAAKTPDWMARRLVQSGMRSISLAVDITNYVMLEIGQPLHAFDGERIEGKLKVQRANKFRSLTTLDGQKRDLATDDILIADEKKPLALAGTMGGQESEVTEKTKRIVLEAAHFLPSSVSRQSRRHQLSSEASRRFERGVDPKLAELASARAALLLIELGGATYHGTFSQGTLALPKPVKINPERISKLLGTNYSYVEISRALTAIGCSIKRAGKIWGITPPTWRGDLQNFGSPTYRNFLFICATSLTIRHACRAGIRRGHKLPLCKSTRDGAF
jgi:phenylalanyl-tRNA synthetase beta chain